MKQYKIDIMNNGFYKTLPKKRMGVGVLLFNESNELLIVKPSYKTHWSIPGGVVDENESPRQAGIRETKEEVGIDIENPRFLCIDYISGDDGKGENLQFMYYGGVLSPEQIREIKIDQDEISEYRFTKAEDAIKFFGEGRKLALRLPKCLNALNNDTAVYLENGE